MITKTTKFKLKYIFLIGLMSASLNAGIAKRLLLPSDKKFLQVVDTGFNDILQGSATVEEVIERAKEIDPRIAGLVDSLIEYLLKEIEKNSNLIHDKEKVAIMSRQFCTGKLGLVLTARYGALLDTLQDNFLKYTPHEFKQVLMTSKYASQAAIIEDEVVIAQPVEQPNALDSLDEVSSTTTVVSQ